MPAFSLLAQTAVALCSFAVTARPGEDHRDPFDRVLVAVARKHALRVLTSDKVIGNYLDVVTVWE